MSDNECSLSPWYKWITVSDTPDMHYAMNIHHGSTSFSSIYTLVLSYIVSATMVHNCIQEMLSLHHNIQCCKSAFRWYSNRKAVKMSVDAICGTTDCQIDCILFCHWELTHWGRDKMADISQTTFWNAFSWMKICKFRLRFHWRLFLRVQITIFQHWFRKWLGADQATSHYLNQWWLVYWRIYVSLGLNELSSQRDHLSTQYDKLCAI